MAEVRVDGSAISTTLSEAARDLGVEAVTAGDVILAVLRRHRNDYVGGRAIRMAEAVTWPSDPSRRVIDQWYADVRAMIAGDLAQLHGRTLIVGISLVDRAVGREVVRSGLFAAIASELEEGLAASLSDRGRERLATIPLAALGAESQSVVLDHGGQLVRGSLSPDGRRALTSGPQ